MWYRPYPPEQKEEALLLMKSSKLFVEDICERLGIKETTLRGWACERQIPLRGRRDVRRYPRYQRLLQRDTDLCELLLSNRELTMTDAGERFGITRERVRQILVELGQMRLYRRLRG